MLNAALNGLLHRHHFQMDPVVRVGLVQISIDNIVLMLIKLQMACLHRPAYIPITRQSRLH